MSDRIQLLVEAERRGMLTHELQAQLNEARRRGLVPGAASDGGRRVVVPPFDALAASRANAREQSSPVDDMGGAERVAARLGGWLENLGWGALELGAQTGVVPFANESGYSTLAAELAQDRHARARTDEPLNETPEGLATGVVADTALMVGGPLYAARLARAPGLLNYAFPTGGRGLLGAGQGTLANAGQGAAIGGLLPADTPQERIGNMGMGAGFAGGGYLLGRGIGAGANALGNAGRYVMAPREMAAARQLEAMNAPREVVIQPPQTPGVTFGTAQASGNPELAAITRGRRSSDNQFAGELERRQRANAEALTQAVTRDGAYANEAAELAARRAEIANRGYSAARGTQFSPDAAQRVIRGAQRATQRLEGNPAAQENAARIERLLTREMPEREIIRNALDPVSDWLSQPRPRNNDFRTLTEAQRILRQRDITPDAALAQLRELRAESATAREVLQNARDALRVRSQPHTRGDVLMNVRDTMNDMISGGGNNVSRSGMATDRNAIPLRNALGRAMERESPEFAAAQAAYRQFGPQITRARVADEMGRRAVDMRGNVTLGRVDNVIRGEDSIVRGVVGRDGRRYVQQNRLTDEQRAPFLAARNDLRAMDVAERAGAGINSQTAQNIANSPISRMLTNRVPLIGPLVSAAIAARNRLTDDIIRGMLLDPVEYNRVMARLPAEDRLALGQQLARIGASGGRVLDGTVTKSE